MKTLKKLFTFTLLVTCAHLFGQSAADASASGLITEGQKCQSNKLVAGNYSNPLWSPDGRYISFTGAEQNGIFTITTDGKNFTELTADGGAGYKYVWSLDNKHIVYRGTRFEGSQRQQYISVVSVADKKKDLLVTRNRLQPPFWFYYQGGKKAAYVADDRLSLSELYKTEKPGAVSFSDIENINVFFYYKEGQIYMLKEGGSLENAKGIQGMDPVVSPDRKKFIYSKDGLLRLRTYGNDNEIILGNGSHPSWAPDGSQIVYQKTKDDGHQMISSDLYIMNVGNLKSFALTATDALYEVNPSWSPDGKSIVFNDEKEGGIYIITF